MGESERVANRFTRREVIVAGAALPAAGRLELGATSSSVGRRARPQGPRVAVVGAGAFGGWTALQLVRAGARVTLIDAWGPGNSRASSGGESRVIRHTYGADRLYTEWVLRALQLWKEEQARSGVPMYVETGVLFMMQEDDGLGRATLPVLRDLGVAHETLEVDELRRRYPQLATHDVRWAIYEPHAGYLRARESCAVVRDTAVREGATFRLAQARPGRVEGGRLQQIDLSDGSQLQADAYVFACGPWLGSLFPEVVGAKVRPTRQEVFYFGLQAGDDRHAEGTFPIWAGFGERLWYGIPGNGYRGFKIADDTTGPAVDPTDQERVPTADGLRSARRYLEGRFPGMRGAPLLEARVCQYEVSPDGHFIIDRHPGADNLWIVGGGSGHGYKHGPALGEHVAGAVLGAHPPAAKFALGRFGAA